MALLLCLVQHECRLTMCCQTMQNINSETAMIPIATATTFIKAIHCSRHYSPPKQLEKAYGIAALNLCTVNAIQMLTIHPCSNDPELPSRHNHLG